MYKAPNPSTKAGQAPSPPSSLPQLSPERRQFLASMLDILIRQLAWPEDTEWEAPGNEDELDEDIAAFKNFRGVGFGKLAICFGVVTGHSMLMNTCAVLPIIHRVYRSNRQVSSHGSCRKNRDCDPGCICVRRSCGCNLAAS